MASLTGQTLRDADRLTIARLQAMDVRGTDDAVVVYNPRLPVRGAVPVVWLLDQGQAVQQAATLTPVVSQPLRFLAHHGLPVIVADYGGVSTWGRDDTVEVSGAIDDTLDSFNTSLGIRNNRVIVAGEGMGAINAANWAWRNEVRLGGLWMVNPIPLMDEFYGDNPSMQASIDAAYGTHPTFLAALPTHDLHPNRARLVAVKYKTRVDYSLDQTRTRTSSIEAFIAGAIPDTVRRWPGNYTGILSTIRGHDIAEWARQTVLVSSRPG